jgi:hypothetical protein
MNLRNHWRLFENKVSWGMNQSASDRAPTNRNQEISKRKWRHIFERRKVMMANLQHLLFLQYVFTLKRLGHEIELNFF